MSIGIAISSGIGVVLGAILEQFGVGIPIGVGIGLAIIAALDDKARKEDRIICPKETTAATTKNFEILAIILVMLFLTSLAAFLFVRQIG